MRIGIDASNLRVGGGVTHVAELLRHADPAEHGVTSVTIWAGRETLERVDERPWLERVHEPMLDGALPRRILWQRTSLPRLASRACDVIFAPGGSAHESFHPYVTMSQNMLPFDPPERARFKYSSIYFRLLALRRLQSGAFLGADAVIFLNDYALERISAAIGLDRARTAVIPHGVADRFRLAPRAQRPLESYAMDAPFRVLYTSIVDLYKHQWNVAEAVIRLRREGLPIALDLVGSAYPPAMAKLEAVLRDAGEHREAVRFHGEIAHDDLPAFYHRADAFAFASTCENLPIILIEAMAAGLPIASSDRRPMPDCLGEGGVYFDPENVASIETALRTLGRDPELRAAKAKTAYDLALRYSWRRCADETFSLLARVGTKR